MRESILILTGAGISADSGVRTFRDAGGLWEGHSVEAVATPEGWEADRALVWRFYQERRRQLREVEPNAAHRALADFAARCRAAKQVDFCLVTQNVDDLHARAGSEALHMHGELSVLRCERCGRTTRDTTSLELETFVACAHCTHSPLRPDVVWFGEVPYHLDAIEAATQRCTHFVAIGTSGAVWPAAGILHAARSRGAGTWVQSLDPPDNLENKDAFYRGRAATTVPSMLAELGTAVGLS